MIPDEEMMIEVRYFEKNVNRCDEYEDAWVFTNTKKKFGPYNPVVFKKNDFSAIPYDMYTKTKLLAAYEVKKDDSFNKIL